MAATAAAAAKVSLICHQQPCRFSTNTSQYKPLLFCPAFQPDLKRINSKRQAAFRVSAANLGGGGGGGGGGEEEVKKKKKFITKEEEPEQYWQTAGEREGENPMKTPLPYIIIFGMSTPFVILAIAFANGWVKVPVR